MPGTPPNDTEVSHTDAGPSIHIRAVLTWLAIFPLVTLTNAVLGLFADDWPPLLRSLALSLLMVPAAVYVVVPAYLSLYMRLTTKRASSDRRPPGSS